MENLVKALIGLVSGTVMLAVETTCNVAKLISEICEGAEPPGSGGGKNDDIVIVVKRKHSKEN